MRFPFLLIALMWCVGCANSHTVPAASDTVTAEYPVPVDQAPQSDPIDALVKRLSSIHGLWMNGLFPKIELAATAPVQQVLKRVFEVTSFGQGRVTTHHIIETREVRIDGGFPPYTVVLVETDLGDKIVLLRPLSSSLGWWSRVYDALPTA